MDTIIPSPYEKIQRKVASRGHLLPKTFPGNIGGEKDS